MKCNVWLRGVALVVSGAMFMNCGGGGLISAVSTVVGLVQGNQMPPHFTEEPTEPWYGRNPGRELRTRGGFYTERALDAIEAAAVKWRRNSGGGFGAVYAYLPSPFAGELLSIADAWSEAAPILATMDPGGGAGIPGEGKSGSGIGGGGSVNTFSGNLLKPFTLASWPSRGELDFAFTLYHNSLTEYNLEFGANWSFNFGAKLSEVAAPTDPPTNDIVIRWGDGSVIAFDNDGDDNFTAPAGCFDELEILGSGNYLVTTPDLVEFEFTPPNSGIANDLGDLVAIRDRNGNEIAITIEVESGKEVVTKVEDSVASRFIELEYDGDARAISMTDHTSRLWEFVYVDGELVEIDYPELDATVYTRTFEYTGTYSPVSRWILSEEFDEKTWQYTYSSGKVLTVENPESETTTYEYETTYTEIIHPDAETEEHHYSGGKLAMKVDESNFNVQYKGYNADRLVTLLQDKRGAAWQFTYNGKGNILTATDPLNHTTTTAYEANDNDIDTVTNHEGEVWDYAYYNTGAKNLWKVIDPESRTLATYEYNAYGDVDSIKDGDGNETTVAYGSDGYPYNVTDPDSYTSKVHFDTLGRVEWVEDPIQAGTGSTDDRVDYDYDEWGRLTTVTHPKQDLMGLDPRYTTSYTYDIRGNVLIVTDERGKTVTFQYDDVGRLTDTWNQEGDHEEYDRNDRGWVTKVTNGRGKERNLTYTPRGDLYSNRFHFGGFNGEGEVYSHDGNGNVTIHAYDKTGFMYESEPKYYEYDAANRLELVDYDTGSMTNVTFDYDDADRMKEMVDGTGTTEWFYDLDGQVNKVITPQGTMEYAYFATTGRLETLTEVLGTNIVTTYTYDDLGRTETIDKFGETTTFEYDEASRPKKMIYDTGAYAKYSYDGRSRITAVEHFNSSHTLLRKETNYYDPASRITSRYAGPASGGVTTTFGYDDIGQLTSESDNASYSATYTYDENGNRETRTVNGITETYTVDDSDKLLSVTWSQGGNSYAKEYAYHYSGRPTSIVYKTNGTPTATETMTWDKESRMLTNSLGNASYAYNGFDARVSKTVGGTTTTFKRAGANPVSPVLSDTTSGTTTAYLPGISSRVSGTSTFSHSGIKSGVLQTNSSQTNTATKRYDAFGNELATSGTWNTRFDYGGPFGYQREDDTGYKLLGHRYYDPEIGRFLTRDPLKDGRNWYAYCGNDPLTHADQDGQKPSKLKNTAIAIIVVLRSLSFFGGVGDLMSGKGLGGLKHIPRSLPLDPEYIERQRRRGKFLGRGGPWKLLVVIGVIALQGQEAAAKELFFTNELGDLIMPAVDDARGGVDGMRRQNTGFDDDELEELTGYRGWR